MTAQPSWQYATANGITLRYLRTGGDLRPLVLAHGFSDSAACWASWIEALRERFDIVAYDARGHGGSDAPPSRYDVDERVADLLGLVATLQLDRPILMGHSMGGTTAGWAAISRPGLAHALVLEDSSLSAPAGASAPPPSDPPRFPEWLLRLRSRSREELIALRRSALPRWPDEDVGPWADSKLELSENAARVGAHAPRPLAAALTQLDAPVLILKADAEEPTKARHRAIAADIPCCHLVHVPGAGHNVRRDAPEATLRAFEELVETHDLAS